MGKTMGRTATNGLAAHLLAANEEQLRLLTPVLIDLVAQELRLPPLPFDHKWPADILEATREFLTCIATDDLERVREAGSVFEQVGVESARGGLAFHELAAGIRLAARRIQAQVHRAVIAEEVDHETESVVELLGRVVAAGEAVVDAARRGHQLASLGTDEGGIGRLLASALMRSSTGAAELAAEAGWPERSLTCAILTDVPGAARISHESPHRVAFYPRRTDVLLFHPVDEGRLATSLRPLLADRARAVGPAVPLPAAGDSLDLAHRAAALGGSSAGAAFADDFLLELACSADAVVVAALRRKHFADLGALPRDQQSVLLATLREWLLQWGHRPGIAKTLGVHPQTVSGRINRLKDLLADDLDDPVVRSELLVLLLGEVADCTPRG